MGKCGNCGQEKESLILADHKDKGQIWICQDCWKSAYSENEVVSGTTCSSPSGCSGCCSN
ncbi:MAG: hypothetical protein ACTSUV_06050 [Candidatus Ranarchaeia archaeon]